ncbi:hypothetical protein Dimus_018859, partial [Dionaea muscipula]
MPAASCGHGSSTAHGHDDPKLSEFFVEGMVYCDTCRVQFEPAVSEPLNGVKLLLECKSRSNGTVRFTMTNTINRDCTYSIRVLGDHEDDLCAVILNGSSTEHCSEIMSRRDHDLIPCTISSGIA